MADKKPANAAKKGATRADAATGSRSPQAKRDAVRAKGTTTADRRAALRAEQLRQQEAARRRRMAKIIAAIIAGVIALAVIIGVVIWQTTKPKVTATPQHVTADKLAYTVDADQAKSNAPTVVLYQDFQCPACKEFETAYWQQLFDLASSGDIKLQIRTLTFLDSNFPQSNKSSYRASMAAAAVDATSDKFVDYFETIYKNQPTTEGQGYTDSQLRNDFATQAGLTGDELTKFQAAYDAQATKSFVTTMDTQAEKTLSTLYTNGAFSTPSVTVNGKLMSLDNIMTSTALANPSSTAMKDAITATE